MFGIGIGEIFVILVVIFLLSPKDLPKAIRKFSELGSVFSNVKNEIAAVEKEIRESDKKHGDE